MTSLTVFISSTITDLSNQRDAVEESLLETGVFDPIRVEKLAARDNSSRYVCLREVSESDAMIVILGERYGFIPEKNNPEDLSVTHLEYRQARRDGVPTFVFVKAEISPELLQARFITEVSDFDDGVLRKTWASSEDLATECRRAMLLWIASKARSRKPDIDSDVAEFVRELPEVNSLRVIVECGSDGEKEKDWCKRLLHEVKSRSLELSLPVLAQQDGTIGPTLTLSVADPGTNGDMLLSIGFEEIAKSAPSIPSITIPLAESDRGLDLGTETIVAYILYSANERSRCIHSLITLASDFPESYDIQAQILWLASFVSAIQQGEESSSIAEMIIDLENPEPHVASAGMMALFAAQLRLSHNNAKLALRRHDELSLRLLATGIIAHPESADQIYNLGRKMRVKMPSAALKVFEELVELDPTYDERWYFHRDVGSIYYDRSDYLLAAGHYDQARSLKENDSELHRHAGDAYYYCGHWARALVRYRKAIDVDPVEQYYVDAKLEFLESRARLGASAEESYVRFRWLGHRLSDLGIRIMGKKAQPRQLAARVFIFAKWLCGMNFHADRALAVLANRRGDYDSAIEHLKSALQIVPENPFVRLDLAVNLIFSADREFIESAKQQVQAAIFHGGPNAREQFRLRLTNTDQRDDLLDEFDTIFECVKSERDEWVKRRLEVTKPEMFGGVMHVEY